MCRVTFPVFPVSDVITDSLLHIYLHTWTAMGLTLVAVWLSAGSHLSSKADVISPADFNTTCTLMPCGSRCPAPAAATQRVWRCPSLALLSENLICITSLKEMITNIRSNIWWRLAAGKQIFYQNNTLRQHGHVHVSAPAPCAHSCPPDRRTSKWCGSSSKQADR